MQIGIVRARTPSGSVGVFGVVDPNYRFAKDLPEAGLVSFWSNPAGCGRRLARRPNKGNLWAVSTTTGMNLMVLPDGIAHAIGDANTVSGVLDARSAELKIDRRTIEILGSSRYGDDDELVWRGELEELEKVWNTLF